MSDSNELVVGIDLGTTNSEIAAFVDGKVTILCSGSKNMLPSVVGLSPSGELLVGEAARNQLALYPDRTVRSIKRKMGSGETVMLGDREFTPPEISALVLRELKARAEAFFTELGEFDNGVDRAVITVPAYFNDAQRQATKDAGRIAGLEVLRLVNEPTAAALAYGLDKRKQGVVAVYDFGGGTFDISILRLHEGIFEVLATNGDTHLGGDDIDNLLLRIALEDIQSEWGEDISSKNDGVQLLRRAVIEAKEQLSFAPAATIDLEYHGRRYQREINRAQFDQLIKPIIDRTMGPCRACIKDAGVTVEQIDEVVLVGGSTRIPKVQQIVKELFSREPHKGVNPDEVVAIGAGIQGGVLGGEVKDLLLLDVTPLSLSIETLGGVSTPMIPRNTTIPTRKSEIFSTATDNQTNVEVHVLQGERPLARDNRTLGQFHLVGLPPAPRGVPQIEVAFDIDANGIVNVTAKDMATGKEQKITISGSSGLSKDDVDRMVKEAKSHASEDQARRDLIDARNQADSLAYQVEKTVNENRGKIAVGDLSKVEAAVVEVRRVAQTDDVAAIKKATEDLQHASHAIAEQLYKQGQTQAQGQPQASGPSSNVKDGEVVDAEYAETK